MPRRFLKLHVGHSCRPGQNMLRRHGKHRIKEGANMTLDSAWSTFADALEILRARRAHKKRAERHRGLKYGQPGMEEVSTADEEGDNEDDFILEESLHLGGSGKFMIRDAALRQKLAKYDRRWGISRKTYRALRRFLAHTDKTAYPYLYDWRWEVIVGSATGVLIGRGDVVLTDGRGGFAVIKLDDGRSRRAEAQALRHARIYGRLHPQATSIVPMLMAHEGLFIYKDKEWSQYRRITTRFGGGAARRRFPPRHLSIAVGNDAIGVHEEHVDPCHCAVELDGHDGEVVPPSHHPVAFGKDIVDLNHDEGEDDEHVDGNNFGSDETLVGGDDGQCMDYYKDLNTAPSTPVNTNIKAANGYSDMECELRHTCLALFHVFLLFGIGATVFAVVMCQDIVGHNR